MTSNTVARVTLLSALLAVVLFCAVVCAIIVPVGRGADEDEHLDHVFHLVEEGRLPDLSTESVGQAQHPPLPYLATALAVSLLEESFLTESGAPVDLLGRRTTLVPSATVPGDSGRSPRRARRDATPAGALHALRGFSVLLGAATILLLWAALRQVVAPATALAVTAFFALTPHFPFHFAMISNDPWMTCIGALSAWHLLRARRLGTLTRPRTLAVAATILGVAFLIKLHAVGPLAFAAVLTWSAHERRTPPGRRLLSLAILAAGPLAIAGWWHARQISLQGGLLSLEHHADFKPWLLRLGEIHPTVVLEILGRMSRTVFAGFGGDLLETWEIYFVLPTGLVALAVLGAFSRPTRGESPPAEESPAPPLRAALFAVGVVVLAVLLANRHYYHVHGRYLFATLVPLGIVLAEGGRRVFGAALGSVLTAGVVWNGAFCLATIAFVIGGRYTIPLEKVERGRVIAYFDCGNDAFDQNAGGVPQTRRYAQLHLPRQTQRFAFQVTPEPEIVYTTELPDAARRYQIRVRYPSPFAAGGLGDVPAPNGCSMLVNSWTIAGPHSMWNELGEMRFPLPEAVTSSGELKIWWQNRCPLSSAVGVAELWIEEAWLQLEEAPTIRRQLSPAPVEGWVRNIDTVASHRFAAFLMRGPTVIARLDGPIEVAPGDRKRIQFDVPDPVPPTGNLRVALRDLDAGPWASTKLAHWAAPGARIGGSLDVPDLQVVRYDPGREGGRLLADVDLGRMLPGEYLVGVTIVGDGDAATTVGLEFEGLEAGSAEGAGPAPQGSGQTWFPVRAELDGKAGDVRVRVVGGGKGAPLTLDRLIVIRAPDAPGVFHRYELVEH